MRAQVTLTGHKGAVTAMRYNASGATLATGAQDTDVILWDVVAETGLFRLRGHTSEVTDLVSRRGGSLLEGYQHQPPWGSPRRPVVCSTSWFCSLPMMHA